jgi:hypothetical protein
VSSVWSAAVCAARGERLVIGQEEIGLHRVTGAVEHRRHPISRALAGNASCARTGRTARCSQARIGGIGIGERVAEELVKVRFAGLSRIDDRVVFLEITGKAGEPERSCWI